MNTILLEHQTHNWQLMYNPALSILWIEAFLNGQRKPLELVDFRLHDEPGDAFITSERGPAVLHHLSQRIWPWQTVQYVFDKYLAAQTILRQNKIAFATPLLFGLQQQEAALNYDFMFLRSFVPGTSLEDYYLQHSSLTPELISLAAEVCVLIQALAMHGFRIEMLRACDIVAHDKQLIIANWWRALPIQKAISVRKKLPLSRFMSAWTKRVDYHELFMESFRRIDVIPDLETT